MPTRRDCDSLSTVFAKSPHLAEPQLPYTRITSAFIGTVRLQKHDGFRLGDACLWSQPSGLRQEDSTFEARLDSVLKCCLRKMDINLDGRCLRQGKPCFPRCPARAATSTAFPA